MRGLLCPFLWGELGPHLTQCRLHRGLPPYQVVSSSIQPFGHNTPMLQTDRTTVTQKPVADGNIIHVFKSIVLPSLRNYLNLHILVSEICNQPLSKSHLYCSIIHTIQLQCHQHSSTSYITRREHDLRHSRNLSRYTSERFTFWKSKQSIKKTTDRWQIYSTMQSLYYR